MNNIKIIMIVRFIIENFKFYTFFLLLALSTTLQADGTIYETDDDDTLETITQLKMNRVRASDAHRETIKQQIIRYNPHVPNWNKLPEDFKIFLLSPLLPHISAYKNAYLIAGCALNHEYFKSRGGYKKCIRKD